MLLPATSLAVPLHLHTPVGERRLLERFGDAGNPRRSRLPRLVSHEGPGRDEVKDPLATTTKLPSFATAATAALGNQVPEAQRDGAAWGVRLNHVWLRWQREDGMYVYLALRRHLDWVTGEAGISVAPADLEALPLRADVEEPDTHSRIQGYRVRLGTLLHEEDRWWPVGETADELRVQLEWLVLQLRVKAGGFFLRHPPA